MLTSPTSPTALAPSLRRCFAPSAGFIVTFVLVIVVQYVTPVHPMRPRRSHLRNCHASPQVAGADLCASYPKRSEEGLRNGALHPHSCGSDTIFNDARARHGQQLSDRYHQLCVWRCRRSLLGSSSSSFCFTRASAHVGTSSEWLQQINLCLQNLPRHRHNTCESERAVSVRASGVRGESEWRERSPHRWTIAFVRFRAFHIRYRA